VKLVREDNYRVSQRVTITRGDRFTATGGPYWKTSDGTKLPLKSYGPYTFHSYVRRGAIEWIECLDKDGCFAVLHIAVRRKRIECSLVARPYKIGAKKRA